MIKTENKNLMLSAHLNLLLEYFKKKESSFTVMHHYYIEGTKFPGQHSQFSLKDAAIQKYRLEDKDLTFISGHLHKGFFYKNYLCVGSIWATSPTENNQLKGIWKKQGGNLSFYEMNLKYYFVFDKRTESENTPLTLEEIQNFYLFLQEETKKFFIGKEIQRNFKEALHLKDVNVTCYSDEMSYEEESLQKIIDPDLEKELHQFNIGKKLEKSEITLE